MRLALISDIHGNDIALQAVLEDINQKGADYILCLGDVAALGPRPAETVHMIREQGCLCIMGNHDAFMNDTELIKSYTDVTEVVESVDWSRDRLTSGDLAFIASFSPNLEIGLDNGFTMYAFHGTPQSNTENLMPDTSPCDLDQMLNGQTFQMAACGHTHVQMLRQHRGKLIVNPGSVGLPYQEVVSNNPPVVLDHAEYAMVETSTKGVSVALCRVPVDRDALLKSALDGDNPLRDWLIRQYS